MFHTGLESGTATCRVGGPGLVLVYMAGQWRDVADFYKGRGARYGTMSDRQHPGVLGILVAVNYLGTRQNKRWDLTSNQVYSLSDQTVKILKTWSAGEGHRVRAGTIARTCTGIGCEEYTYQSPKLTTEFIDPEKNPTRARRAESALARRSWNTRTAPSASRPSNEQDLTNALIKAVTGETRKVYFTQGHGEKDTARAIAAATAPSRRR